MPWTSEQSPQTEAPVRSKESFGAMSASPQQGSQEFAHRESIERRRQTRGLVILAVTVLLFSLWRFGFDRVFPPGWWRLW